MRWFVLILLCFVGAGTASALDNSSPETLLRGVYERYRGAGAGLDVAGPEAQQVLDPSLFALVRKNRSSALGETGVLDHDPFCDCQDYDVSEPVITVKPGAAETAVADVSFKNFGRPFTMTFDLRHGPSGWLITDVRSAATASLRTALSGRGAEFVSADLKRIGVPNLASGMRYRSARVRFFAAGWKPYRSPGADGCPSGDSRCRGFPEVESCAGTGEGNCIFLWRRAGRIVEVSTIDDPSVLAALSCRSGCKTARR